MSLINDALKKAQRLRTGDPPGTVPPFPGGGTRVAKRSQPRSAQQLMLLAVGGVVLVVLSVIVTVWLVNRPSGAKAAAKPSAAKSAAETAAPSAVIVAPVIKPPAPAVAAEAPPAKSEPAAVPKEKPATPAPLPSSPVAAAPTPAPVKPPVVATPESPPAVAAASPAPPPSPVPVAAAAPAPAATDTPTPVAAAPPKADERIHAFVDALRVTGIRSSGDDSRVLMSDRVFRVNDIVDRTLGLRLTKVEHDNLTFTDANGAIYVKYF